MDRIPTLALIAGLMLLALAWIATRPTGGDSAGGQRIDALAAEVTALQTERRALRRRLDELESAMDTFAIVTSMPVLEPEPAQAAEQELMEEVEADETTSPEPASVQRIEDAGLTDEEYTSMQQRAQALYLENFEQEWLERRQAFLANDPAPDARDRLRSELGDDAYDRYLYASGRPNRVRVRRVMADSAAAQAGITEGDVLLSYDGERLFRFDDLRAASYQGEPGDTVLLEVRREDGTVAQMVIPRGPMGISGYGGWREAPGS